MKTKPATTILIALAFATVMFLTPPAIQAASSNDNDKAQAALDELKILVAEKAPANAKVFGVEQAKWKSAQKQKITESAKALYEAYPNAPQRWEAVLIMLQNKPEYYLSIGPSKTGHGYSAKPDTASAEKWRQQAAQLAAKLKAAPDVPDQTQRDFNALLLREAIRDLSMAHQTNNKTPVPQGLTDDYRSKNSSLPIGLKNFLARWPDYDAKQLFLNFIHLPDFQKFAAAQQAIYKEFQDTPNTSVRDCIKEQLAQMDKIANHENITFTALDGSEVNLEKMRGKDVLFYVWNTGSIITKYQYPALLKLYNARHSKGLEIIGISIDDANAKDQVLAFIKEQSVPWPISYEGKVRAQNPIAKALGLDEEGCNFALVDKKGKVSILPRTVVDPASDINRLLNQKPINQK